VPDIVKRLSDLASRFSCAWVAGLIDEVQQHSGERNSSACLIGSKVATHKLCLKSGSDDTAKRDMGFPIYQPFAGGYDAPFLLGTTAVAALICMDATEQPEPNVSNKARHTRLREKVANLKAHSQVLCVPANTRYFSTSGIATEWPGFHFALANGWPEGHNTSVIRIVDREVVVFPRGANLVLVETMQLGFDAAMP
jgi:hypothetical protein